VAKHHFVVALTIEVNEKYCNEDEIPIPTHADIHKGLKRFLMDTAGDTYNDGPADNSELVGVEILTPLPGAKKSRAKKKR
jgi:hypothetical protein